MGSNPSVDAIVDSPVLTLEGNILWQFENLSEFGAQTLKTQVAQGTLSGEIALDMSASPPKGPGVTPQAAGIPEIHIALSHLEMIWAFVYGWMVVYEEGVQKPQLFPTRVMDAETVKLVDQAHELLEWSASLREAYTPWPAGLPSPRHYSTKQEEWYGLKANLVYQKAISYLLSHERAHAALGHLDVIQNAAGAGLRLDMEKEADAAAREPTDKAGFPLDEIVLNVRYSVKNMRCSRTALGPANVYWPLVERAGQYKHKQADQQLRINGEQFPTYAPQTGCAFCFTPAPPLPCVHSSNTHRPPPCRRSYGGSTRATTQTSNPTGD